MSTLHRTRHHIGRKVRALQARLAMAEHIIQAQRRVIEVFPRLSALALREQPPPDLLQEVVQEIRAAVGLPIVAIAFYDEAREVLELAAATGVPHPGDVVGLHVPVAQTRSGRVARSGQVLVETHAKDGPEDADPILHQLGVQTVVCLPLASATQSIGILVLAHPETIPLDTYLVPLAQSLASGMASLIAWQRADTTATMAPDQLREILNKLATEVVQLDAEGRYLFANARAAASFGLTPAELIGKSLFDLFPPEVAQQYLERNRRFIADQAFEEREETFELSIGRRTFLIADQVLADCQGVGSTLLTSTIDITTRRQSEQALQRSEAELHTVVDYVPDIIFTVDRKLRIQFINRVPAGMTVDNALGTSALAYVLPAYRDLVERTISQVFATGQPAAYEIQARGPDEAPAWYMTRLAPVQTGTETTQVLLISQDVTAARATQERLSQREAQLHLVLETTSEGFCMVDSSGRLLEVNPAYCAMSGYTRAELLQRCVADVEALEEGNATTRRLAEMLDQGSARFESRHRRKDGSLFDVEVSVNVLDPARGWLIVFCRDITARKQTEAALQRHAQILRQAQAMAHLITWSADLRSGIFVSAAASAELMGWAPGPHTLEELVASVHPDDRAAMQAAWAATLKGAPYAIEHRILRAGEVRWVRVKAEVACAPDGTPISAFGITQDITEPKQAELALRASEERYHGLMESLDSQVILVDEAGALRYLNEVAARQLGGAPREFIGKTLHELFAEPAATAQLELVRAVIREDQARTIEAQHMQEGQPHWYRTTLQPIHDATGRPISALINATDIHDLKATQQQLIELNQTLEARVAQRTAEVQDLYDQAPVGYHSLDVEGRIVRVNQTELDWLGYTREELIGRLLRDLMVPISPALDPSCFAQVKSEGGAHDLERELIRKDGSILPVLLSATAVYDASGTFVMTRSTITDITVRKQAEAALRESEARYRTLVEQMTQGVLVYQDEQVVFGNAAAAAIIGCNVDELQQASLTDLAELLHADDRHRVMIPPEERPGAGAVTAEPFRFTRSADGALRWVLATSTCTTAHGRPAVLAMFTDVTALKVIEERLRLSEARLHLLLDKTPAIIFSSLAEPDFRSTFISESVRQVLGYTPAQFLRSPGFWASRIHPEDKARVFGDAPQLLVQGWRQYEYRCCHADGRYRWVESGVSLLPATAGHPAEVVGYMIDITTRKEAEELLRQANRELARAARLKDEFLANMSHELRTPLNAILGFSENLQAAVYEPLTARQRTAIRHIETSGRHLLALINDILDLAKVEAGRLTLRCEQFEIAEICQASLLFVKELAYKKALQLSFQLSDPQAMMEGDARRLKQMLINLLANAVKFTPEGGQVSLEITMDAGAGTVCFAVRDTGIGIAAEEQARLFQPFVQLDSALGRQHEGTGLGLALVRRLAELHGGRVSVTSVMGVGSQFTITLPASQARPVVASCVAPQGSGLYDEQRGGGSATQIACEAMPPQPPTHDAPAVIRVLLTDDNEDNLVMTSEYLYARGYAVAVARTGQEALDQVAAVNPSVILMDIQMPDLDGLEVIRRLRAHAMTTPILALTALAMPGDRERCLEAGANEYLTKPVSLRDLVEVMRVLLGR